MQYATVDLRTHKHQEYIDITEDLRSFIREKGFTNGLLQVFIPHTTAGVTINEHADSSVVQDILANLKKVTDGMRFAHLEGNSDAHVKATLTGSQTILPVKDGKLLLGTWQGVFFCEYDGPRNRRYQLTWIEG